MRCWHARLSDPHHCCPSSSPPLSLPLSLSLSGVQKLDAAKLGHNLDLYEKKIRADLKKWGSGGNDFLIGVTPISNWAQVIRVSASS